MNVKRGLNAAITRNMRIQQAAGATNKKVIEVATFNSEDAELIVFSEMCQTK